LNKRGLPINVATGDQGWAGSGKHISDKWLPRQALFWDTRALVEDNDVRAASANILQSRRKVLFAVPIGPPRIADDPTHAADPERVEFGDLTIE